jgi:hypothetical protein
LRLNSFSPPAYTFARQENEMIRRGSTPRRIFYWLKPEARRLTEARAFYFREA